jgi:LysR family transcriptional regulator, nitrogen assimilation regulatory protein
VPAGGNRASWLNLRVVTIQRCGHRSQWLQIRLIDLPVGLADPLLQLVLAARHLAIVKGYRNSFPIAFHNDTITKFHRGPSMDLRQLRSFLTVADTGNVTRASELLNLVQPAVSRQLRLLEEDLGVELFQRKRHGMVLTEPGKALCVYARRALLELDRARTEIKGSADGIAGLVTVGLLPSTCDIIASPLVSAVAARYPGIRMRIAMGYAGDLQGWLETGEIDIALLYGVERDPQVQARPLLEEPLWVVGTPGANLNRRRPVSFPNLRGKPMILPSGPRGIRTLVDKACAVSNVELMVVAETNAMSIQKSLVLGKQGLTILPPIAFAAELASKRVSAAPLVNPRVTRTIAVALSGNRSVGRHVQRTVDLLVQCARNAVESKQWPEASWVAKA